MATSKAARRPRPDKTCKQMTELIYDYLNDRLIPPVKRNFERHLRLCPDCVSFLSTYKNTIRAIRCLTPEDVPPVVRDSFMSFLRRQTRRSGGAP
jgi:hypothetical protein